jgi:hypothetical protein
LFEYRLTQELLIADCESLAGWRNNTKKHLMY